ncbi:zinc finger protein 40 isoform X2 [Pleurodeles waltl]|uniref:zinc finger protein 40 isoform X2 n=1 Tax=Pleurodeles waltl TaxID=8319 RepID=UPI0037098BCA
MQQKRNTQAHFFKIIACSWWKTRSYPEITETGGHAAVDRVKGIKRKKIVTENQLKKISRSPLRTRTQEKLRHKPENSTASDSSNVISGHKVQVCSHVHKIKEYCKHNGGVSNEISVEPLKPGTFIQPREDSLPQQSLDMCHGEYDVHISGDKLTEDKSVSDISSDKTSDNIALDDCSTFPSCTNTALDVLLKAMEPELSTLTQKFNHCGAHADKLRAHKIYSSFPSGQNNPQCNLQSNDLSQQEFVSRTHHYPCAARIGPLSTSGRSMEALAQPTSQTCGQHEKCVSQIDHRLQRVGSCPSSAGLLESVKLKQMYSLPIGSSAGHSLCSIPQALIPHQLTANSSQNKSTISSNSAQLTVGSAYNLAQVASLVNQSGEQMCAVLLKDHKSKKQGKYICEYCNRACAKPSVLLKHIRSHTGERPYPCVTCDISFKTKSNLYKHKKSHTHAIRLGLKTDSGGLIFSQDSDKSLCVNSDLDDESGESDEECTSEERQNDQQFLPLESPQAVTIAADSDLHSSGNSQISQPDHLMEERLLLENSADPTTIATLPKVVVYPVPVSPSRVTSPKPTESAVEYVQAQRPVDCKSTNNKPSLTRMPSLNEAALRKEELLQSLEKHVCDTVASHAQLQRQQATDCSLDQQGKCLLSPRSLGSTDSGYFSRSESADQTMSPPSPFIRVLPNCEKDAIKNLVSVSRTKTSVASIVQLVCGEKSIAMSGTMMPPVGTKTLEERISKLISDNEAVVDDKQLDSVKPRRTSLSRRGSIDSPKSYIFKDSFQFDLKPVCRRTSSGSEIPKSPFTPNEKSKQVFFLSVPSQFPSVECLPITRSNSMPTSGCSAIPPTVVPPPHPLRGSQSFDDKIGALCDDVFVSAPTTPLHQVVHPRTLVRQTAVEDLANDSHCLGPVRSVDEGYHGCSVSSEVLLPRSKSFAQGHSLDKLKKSHQGRGTMFECETCRNRYRKLENFENHKKFYCSELHGPKSKPAVRESDQNVAPSSIAPQVLHYRVAGSTGILEQPPQIRKRRKVKSVGDDDEPQQIECSSSVEGSKILQCQNSSGSCSSSTKNNVVITGQYSSIPLPNSQLQLISCVTEESMEPKCCSTPEQINSVVQEKAELKRQGSGISVIQHTNSLSRPNSFEKLESFERASPVSFIDISKSTKSNSPSNIGLISVDEHSNESPNHIPQFISSDVTSLEVQEMQSVVSNVRNTLLPQSRLVRQHNIQVPEILVTEEPDQDRENAANDQEITETFNWPQRSESLSNLPTEKLPPKKKRIRLADLENSSGESSFDSTLSRSLSRDSSLSRASSFSASFDKEDTSKAECSSKVEVATKSSEFLTLPTCSSALGVPREMRRAASEQITCTQPSMEVPDYRSKSFDCGSMSPSTSVLHSETSKSLCTGVTGHVPLLERRRGPFVRQISLNIAPENTLPQGKSTCIVQKSAEISMVSFHKSQASSPAPGMLLESSLHLPTYIKTLIESQSLVKKCSSSSLPSVEQLHSGFRAQHPQSPLHNSISASADKIPVVGGEHNISSQSRQPNEMEGCFAPKYQLCVLVQQENTIYPSDQSLKDLSSNLSSSSQGFGSSGILVNKTNLFDSLPSRYPVPRQVMSGNSSNKLLQSTSFVVPVHDYSNLYPYGGPTLAKLPEILVTQDQVNQSVVCKANKAPMPAPEDNMLMPKCLEDSPRSLPNSHNPPSKEHNFSETMGQNTDLMGCLNFSEKVVVGGLLPQQEATASSKRMLSPANSLDIAMEKNQKRVKDESGAAFTSEARSVHFLSLRGSDPNRPKKPVLVRQVCTMEPLDSLDQEVATQQGQNEEVICSLSVPVNSNHSSDNPAPQVSESLKETTRLTIAKSSLPSSSPVRRSPEPSSGNIQSSYSKSSSTSQECRLTVVTSQGKQVNIQGQIKLGTSISMINAGDMHRLSFPSLKTTTSFTWCYLLKRKPLQLPQNDFKTSAYSAWTVSQNNPNPLGLPTKLALSLLNSKQKEEKSLYTHPGTSRPRLDILVYSSKWKNRTDKQRLANHKATASEVCEKENPEAPTEHDKEGYLTKHEPRRVKIFDGGYKSNEEYVYVRGRGRGKYICEECGIRCKKPSMLKKHIRTHTDVRPYRCNYCNFSFKTKGNLTKHMKSKAHSKKCIDLGVSDDLYDDQDAEEAGERPRFGCDKPGFDVDDSDGQDEDDNDNDDEDEDSQAESVLSTTPSVTASPQHLPYRNSQHETSSADEELRVPGYLSRADSMDVLPKALLTKMTALSTTPGRKESGLQVAVQQETNKSCLPETGTDANGAQTLEAPPKSPCHRMSIDSPDVDDLETLPTPKSSAAIKDGSSVKLPSSPVDRGTQTTMVAPFMAFTEYEINSQKTQVSKEQATEFPSTEAHLFSHLPLHSQHPTRAPYNVPLSGIQLVPAGLAAYSAFVPLQAGQVQLTFPAVGVFHRSASTPCGKSSETPGPTNTLGVSEVNSVLPCIPIGQVHVPGLPKLTTPLPSLSMETLNILGLTNSNLGPQIHPSGLTLNALGLQVLTASPSTQSNPGPQTHIPGLQILNIALPTLIPSVSPVTVDGQGLAGSPSSSGKPSETQLEQRPTHFPVTGVRQFSRAGSPHVLPGAQDFSVRKGSEQAVDHNKLNVQKTDPERGDRVRQTQMPSDITSENSKTASATEPFLKVHSETSSRSPAHQTSSPDRQIRRRMELSRRQSTVQFSDASSDDDEDRLVIAT